MTEQGSDHREIEAKFDADATSREALLHLDAIEGFSVESRKTQRQDDIYFDTAAGDLENAGATLRVRRLPNRVLMTFKGDPQSATADNESHFASRIEDETEISAEQATQVTLDSPLPPTIVASPLKRARQIVSDATLLPIARLENERIVIDLVDPERTHLELAVDHCLGTRLRDDRTVEFHEVEVELKKADRASLATVSRSLQQRIPGLTPGHRTKLERTMG